jgi:hypothetical protein
MISGSEIILILLALVVATGLFLIMRPPEQLLRRLGVPVEPTKEERLVAEGRANLLLRQLLGDEEFERFARRSYLDVPSPSISERVYRVPSSQGMVDVIEGGIATMRLCVVPTRWVPDADVVIMHKLLIEGDEARYLRVANRFPAGSSRLIIPPWWEPSHGIEPR